MRRESPSGRKKLFLAVRQRKIDCCREAWIAIRRKKIDCCREAKKKLILPWGVNRHQAERNWFLPWGKEKSISPWGVNRRQAERNRFLPWGEEKLIVAVRRESLSGGNKSIFAVRQRKNRYRCEAWIAVRWKEIDFCREAKKKSISPWGEEKIDIAAKKNRYLGKEKSISRQRKNRYRSKEKSISRQRKIDIAAKKESAVAESSYRTLEHHLRGEQKRKLCLLERLSTELSKALRDRRCGQKISFWWHHQGHGQTNPA